MKVLNTLLIYNLSMENNEYIPNDDMQVILDFLERECTYKERESGIISDAIDVLMSVGWVFERTYLPDNETQIRFYNKHTLKGKEVEKWASKYVGRVITDNTWKIIACNAIDHLMWQLKLQPQRQIKERIINEVIEIRQKLDKVIDIANERGD